jgi:hypothetical protein
MDTSPIDPSLEYYPPALRKKYGLEDPPRLENLMSSNEQASADIGWVPDMENFLDRRARMAKSGEGIGADDLPEGWPKQVEGPRVWRGDDLDQREYSHELSSAEILDLKTAIASFKGSRFVIGINFLTLQCQILMLTPRI